MSLKSFGVKAVIFIFCYQIVSSYIDIIKCKRVIQYEDLSEKAT